MGNKEIVEMLKEMQIETAKCNGFFAGHVTQAWVIKDLLGKKIEELGGKPYVIRDNKLVDSGKAAKLKFRLTLWG